MLVTFWSLFTSLSHFSRLSYHIIILCLFPSVLQLRVNYTNGVNTRIYNIMNRKVRLMKPTHDSLLLRVSCLRTHQTVFEILSDECVSTKLGVTVNHVLVSLASPFYDLALHLCVLSTILTVLAALLLLIL